MDNTLAIAYVSWLGGIYFLVLSNLALALWEHSLLRASSSAPNIFQDWESRHFHGSSNWKLRPEVFRALMKIREPCTKDLFANHLNARLPQFFASVLMHGCLNWRPNPMALASGALQKDGSNERNYAFPPFCLIMRSLAKLRELGGELVLVDPVWPTQAWYPCLLVLSVSLSILLPTSQSILLGPQE